MITVTFINHDVTYTLFSDCIRPLLIFNFGPFECVFLSKKNANALRVEMVDFLLSGLFPGAYVQNGLETTNGLCFHMFPP